LSLLVDTARCREKEYVLQQEKEKKKSRKPPDLNAFDERWSQCNPRMNLIFIIVVLTLDLQFSLTRSGLLELLGERGTLFVVIRVLRDLALDSSLALSLGLETSRGSSGAKNKKGFSQCRSSYEYVLTLQRTRCPWPFPSW
jgi:hypothetical protein